MKYLRLYKKDGRTILLNIDAMEKAKRAEIGEVRTWKNGTKRKKVAEGKWEIISDPKTQKNNSKDKKKKNQKKTQTSAEKSKLKGIIKKIVEIVSDAMSGRDVVSPTGQAIEETGENIKRKKQ